MQLNPPNESERLVKMQMCNLSGEHVTEQKGNRNLLSS